MGNWNRARSRSLGPDGTLEIPITWWKGVVSAKLRGQADEDTVLYVSDSVAIDKSVTFEWLTCPQIPHVG